MRRDDFLERIYERAVADSPTAADALTALQPVAAPELAAGETVAQEAADRPELASRFEDLSTAQAPGWLWQRIREDLRTQRRAQSRPRVLYLRMAAAAAVLVALGLGISLNLKNVGTSVSDDIVIEELDAPLGPLVHPSDVVRRLAK